MCWVLTRSWTATVIGPQRSSRWRKELEPFFFKIWQEKTRDSLMKQHRHVPNWHKTLLQEHLHIKIPSILPFSLRDFLCDAALLPNVAFAASWENRQVPWVCLRACWVSQTSPNPRGLNIAPSWEVAYFRARSALQKFNPFIDWDGSRIPKRTSDSSCSFFFFWIVDQVQVSRTAWAVFVPKTNRFPAQPRQPLTQRTLNKYGK